jgi:choline dehydrogenase-like flavoprotein
VILDGRSTPAGHTLRADVCIVGAGAAGLTIAQELASQRMRVLVVESGSRDVRHETQRLYEGDVAGQPYYPLDTCRFRVLGGTTSQWGGWCRPLDAIDFEAREWVPASGWPITKQQMATFYARAHEACRLGTCQYDGPRHGAAAPLVPTDDGHFSEAMFQVRPTRFGEAYAPAFHNSSRADLLLNSNVLEIVMDRSGERACHVRASALEGKAFSIAAGAFVLAAGGIENPRLLLCSGSRGAGGIGNQYDLVGRYFSDHLHVPIGMLRAPGDLGEFYRLHHRQGVAVRGAITLTEETRRRIRGLGFAVTLHDADDPHDVLSLAQVKPGYRSLHALVHAIRRRRRPDRLLHHLRNVMGRLPEASHAAYRRFVKRPPRHLVIGCRAEQAPNADSRVTLDSRCDPFGMPRARLDWKISEQDVDSLQRAQDLLARALRDQHVDMYPFRNRDGTGWADRIAGGAHHMGTTRMHRDPRHGVVNEDCRVHGTSNVYVAGSSVFPTGGWAPPTLTVVALALRLAEHLADGGRRPPS